MFDFIHHLTGVFSASGSTFSGLNLTPMGWSYHLPSFLERISQIASTRVSGQSCCTHLHVGGHTIDRAETATPVPLFEKMSLSTPLFPWLKQAGILKVWRADLEN
jgi:hypothetical protein